MIQKENDPFLFDLNIPWKGNLELTKHLRLRTFKREVIGVMEFLANIRIKIVLKKPQLI